MAFCYQQSTGRIWRGAFAAADKFEAHGYSGQSTQPWPLPPGVLPLEGEGRNRPNMQDKHNIGPIPRGCYTIGYPRDTTTHGPYVMDLVPDQGVQTFGRSGFLIHGDKIGAPGTASQGCIILPAAARYYIGYCVLGKAKKEWGIYPLREDMPDVTLTDNRIEIVE